MAVVAQGVRSIAQRSPGGMSAQPTGQTVRGYWDRFHRDGIWADLAALLTPTARARLGRNPTPSTGIVDSQSVVSGPQKGERGVDGNKNIRGIKRHVLTCSFGFVLAVFVSAANLHDTHGLAPLLEQADATGWRLTRVKVDGIYHDTHTHPVRPEVLDLLAELRRRTEPPGALLERDGDFPTDAELAAELAAIRERW